MDTVTTTFVLANWIVKGLANADLERIGGVIREIGTKKIVTWLREYETNASQVPTPTGSSANLLNLALSGANLVTSGANAAVSGKGIADVSQHLAGIEQQVGNIEQHLQQAQGILLVGSTASVLSLGVSVMGFAVVHQLL